MSELSHQHISAGTLRAYRDGHADPADTLAVSDALAECGECRASLAALPPAPTYEEIAAAADRGHDADGNGSFADEPAARAELADLLAFRREMAGREAQVFGPATRSGQDVAVGKVVPLPEAFWRRKSFASLAAAALVLLAGGWWMFAHSGEDGSHGLLNDGQGQRVDLATLSPDLRDAVGSALRDGRLPTAPALTALRPPSGTLAGTADAAAFRVLSPVGVVVRNAQPTLRWTARAGAERHKVILVDTLDGNERSVDFIGSITAWKTPMLVPGRTYEWQVEATTRNEMLDRAPKPPAPEARFRVLEEVEQKELARIEARYGQYPLVMAVAYARVGLKDEETAALDRLKQEHPQSPLAQRLRAEQAAPAQLPSPIRTNGAQ